MSDLLARLDELAQTPVLLVATDFDGTLAPIVPDPAQAQPDREALVALRMLSELPQTHVAVVSGRGLDDLARRAQEAGDVHLVGSHGSEFEPGFAETLPEDARHLLTKLRDAVQAIADGCPGALVEQKAAALAFHYRQATQPDARRAVAEVEDGPARWPGVHVRRGKMVVELSVVATDKGAALARLRQRVKASAVLFLGDDATDEDAFATLAGPDAAIKVGSGPTVAPFRVPGPHDVAPLLARIAERRHTWLAGSQAVPIEQHALLSDQRTVALLAPAGRIVWLCLPRLDSSAVFAELLGGPTAGFFDIHAAASGGPVAQEYVEDSFVVRTRWPGLTVTDYLECGAGRAFQRAGRTDLIRAIEGRGKAIVTFAPRLDFGRVQTHLHVADGGIVVEGAVDPLVLYAPGLHWQVEQVGNHQTATAVAEVSDAPVVLELRYGTASLADSPLSEAVRRQRTVQAWQGWAAGLQRTRVAPDHVRRSALVLRALTYGPTGAIAAAATTSLPECAGGVRNWDYRFCWPRDAAMAAAALVRLGVNGPAIKYLDWLLGIIEPQEPPTLLRPVYTVTGGHLGSEAEVGELAGYRGSRPVRVGNAAAQQVQLDVYGPIADLVALLAERGAPLSSDHWHMLETMVASVAQRWQEPDHGIWELRRPRQQHLHSKVMCWQTVDRALAVADYLGRRRGDWGALARTIAEDVRQHGTVNESAAGDMPPAAFGATYGDHEPDAAALWVGLSGLLPPDHPQFRQTVESVERRLRNGPTVYRYRYDDGLPGVEGGFNLCTTWLIEAYARLGRHDEAAELFEQYLRLAGPTGLLAEEYDPDLGQALGNYPQAYSHLGLINAALAVQAGGKAAQP